MRSSKDKLNNFLKTSRLYKLLKAKKGFRFDYEILDNYYFVHHKDKNQTRNPRLGISIKTDKMTQYGYVCMTIREVMDHYMIFVYYEQGMGFTYPKKYILFKDLVSEMHKARRLESDRFIKRINSYRGNKMHSTTFYKTLSYYFEMFKHYHNGRRVTMKYVVANYKPNMKFLLESIGIFLFPLDVTHRHWKLQSDIFTKLVYEPPTIPFQTKYDLSNFKFKGMKKERMMTFEDFSEAIEDMSKKDILEMISEQYGVVFSDKLIKDKVDIKHILYKLTQEQGSKDGGKHGLFNYLDD